MHTILFQRKSYHYADFAFCDNQQMPKYLRNNVLPFSSILVSCHRVSVHSNLIYTVFPTLLHTRRLSRISPVFPTLMHTRRLSRIPPVFPTLLHTRRDLQNFGTFCATQQTDLLKLSSSVYRIYLLIYIYVQSKSISRRTTKLELFVC